MPLTSANFETERSMIRGGYSGRSVWHGAAFVLEALLLLLFIVISLTVFMGLFAGSNRIGQQSDELSKAVTLATDTAEEFAAYPIEVQGEHTSGDFVVDCTVSPESMEGGTLYNAHIVVSSANEGHEIYSLDTSVYKRRGGA